MPTVSDARLASVLDTAVDGIILIEERGRILVFNRACEALFGYTSEEVIGMNIKVIMPMDYAEKHDAYIGNYINSGVKRIIGIGREVRGRHKDGTVFPLELSVGEAVTPDGRQFIGVLRDLRPRKEAEQRLSQLQADLVHMARVNAMDEMGAAMAHELNQPLTAIMLYLQAVTRAMGAQPAEKALPPHVSEILGKSLREAGRAGSIIQRMRHFVEKREPERRLADVRTLVDEAVELTMLGNRSGVSVVREHQPDLPGVLVDAVQIQQIVVNLVRNAVEALRGLSEPRIRLRTWSDGAKAYVSVADNGPGIPPEAMTSIFKAFSTSKRTGLGLGLAISRSIAQNHGGDLSVDPGGNGRGAEFILHLPLDAAK